jgi:endonuclease/exonuclease/phosphatase family metal-dependent hydrolase
VRHTILVLLWALALSRATAGILLNEPFSYADGPLTNVSAGTWTTHSTSSYAMDVANEAAVLVAGSGDDVNRQLTGQPYPAAGTTNVFYAAFTVRFSALPTAGGAYFAHFDAGTFRGRVHALAGGAPAGQFRLGLSSTVATINQTNTAINLNLNSNYRLVVRLTNTTGVATLWINPATEADPSITTAGESVSGSTVSSFALRQNAGIGTLTVDDLVVATTFTEALDGVQFLEPPTVIENPVTQVINEGENAVMRVSATGREPLAYQWWLNGAPVPDATNNVLALTNTLVSQAGLYWAVVSNPDGTNLSDSAILTVLRPARLTPALSVLNFNAMGNSDGDWTTNNAQVRALGRIVQFLNPDIITFQEIPMTNAGWSQMPAFVDTYLPGYHLATNSGTDGFIRSVIISRHPILRSQSWLDGADLNPFGYTNANFTRDLFEAEIAVPYFDDPVHVFTTHLKSGTSSSDDAARRAAEASAISNFFVNVFLPVHGERAYLLTGDLNEDIDVPATGSQQPIQRLVNDATGLRLTRPRNHVTASELTHSIQSVNGLTRRYDYVLPCGLLYTNMASNLVFRTDVLTPLPPNLFSNDSVTASDHPP